jgi:hypothetical protein
MYSKLNQTYNGQIGNKSLTKLSKYLLQLHKI